jgi:lipoprotein-releasing system ATP-binding protein
VTDALLSAASVQKGYHSPAGDLAVLRGANLEVRKGEMVAIVGASGVGKSTLLHVLGTLDRFDSGRLLIAGEDVGSFDEGQIRAFRNKTIGFVFQMHHLLPEFSAEENVMMPLLVARTTQSLARRRSLELLDRMGLLARKDHRPGELSGGEQQRVAVARALACRPRLLLADEPSGNLDRETGDRLHDLLHDLNRDEGLTIVVVTHNDRLAASAGRTLRLEDGLLQPL